MSDKIPRDKIDDYAIHRRDPPTLQRLLRALRLHRPDFVFAHFRGPDTAGHWRRWMSAAYLRAVQRQDDYLKQLLACVESTPGLKGQTTLLVTTDHGGSGHSHRVAARLAHYRIPWLAWGKGVARGADLYALNVGRRADPGDRRVPYGAPRRRQPIRNGDVANAVAALFGLPPVPGSSIGAALPLKLQ